MAAQTERAERGPEQGIRMTPQRLARYMALEGDMEILRGREELQKLLCLSTDTHLYLSAEREMATFSAWLSGVDEMSVRRLESYYALLPEKRPDGIYIEAEYQSYADIWIGRGYQAETLPSGAWLLTKTAPGRE